MGITTVHGHLGVDYLGIQISELCRQVLIFLLKLPDSFVQGFDSIFNFFDPRYLGDTFVLDKDYRLVFGVKQGAK